MKPLLLYIFSLCLLQATLAQVDTTASESLNRDSIAIIQTVSDLSVISNDTTPEVKPQVVKPALSFDYGKAITTLAGVDKKYEVGLSLLFMEQYLLVAEAGTGILQPKNAIVNGTYTSEGNYIRFGGGYMNQINLTSKLGLGAMYALSNFSHRGEGWLGSDVQSVPDRVFEESGLEARWLEVFITSESWVRLNKDNPSASINKRFALGFQIRFRFLTSRDSFHPFDVYMIPGYGRVVNDPQLALNLFVKFYPF